ncbi:hypothetical protein [Roseateles asaccharophilus]|uniref:Uncharacterized protein n=1 Tax=Roseateles asaccharophilus TaxID=582607 RepID=A0ABU2A271_9BURK|nr:hypothetical protein [Roseateles asaccharophilus]MDR7331292.1 hypothetical protein [Roseateles asaccharophilus]
MKRRLLALLLAMAALPAAAQCAREYRVGISELGYPASQILQRHLDALRREGWVQATYARHVGEAEVLRLFRSEAR